MTVLSVNLNKIAWLRNAREGHRPNVLNAARTAIEAGAQGITVHPRPDQRHIRPDDVYQLSEMLTREFPHIEFNIEGNPEAGPNANGYPGFDALIETTRPTQATLVPDSDDQLTSDHGYDLSRFDPVLAERIAQYKAVGARVSLFMDPIPALIEAARDHGADRIELYTGPFAEAFWQHGEQHQVTLDSFRQYLDAARFATQVGLGVNAGHDLDLDNLPLFAEITEVAEVSIGHALISDALDRGLFSAVAAYARILKD